MSGQWAVIKDGLVINAIVWDGPEKGEEGKIDRFGPGTYYVEIPEDSPAGPFYTYEDGVFYPPKPTEEEIENALVVKRRENILLKDSLMSTAIKTITIWQTKLMIGRKLTAAEKKSLNAWLDYTDALDLIDPDTTDDIDWPTQPS